MAVVAILVGAGALEALERFFSGLPKNPGCAFVVLRDLSGELDLFVQRLLARCTGLPARATAAGEELVPNTIHLLACGDGSFDGFLGSLAAEAGGRAAAVVLSGDRLTTAAGLQQFAGAGGLVLVQEPATASFEVMPCAAIAAVPEAVVLPPESMVLPLLAQLRLATGELEAEAPLKDVLALLLRRYGIDFSTYRLPLLMRRLQRRAAFRRMPDLGAFEQLLRHDPEELERLHDDFLIGVTAFMRDREAFGALASHVLPALAARRRALRIWVPGCASGEEAFSIAMVLREHALQRERPLDFAIFATDVHRRSLDLAAQAFYPDDRLAGLDPELVDRHFMRLAGGWRPRPELRRCVVFSAHDLLADPPLSRMDLVSCRNLLIYLTAEAQREALGRLHASLVPGGYLFLGSSESVGGPASGFEPVEPRWRIFRRREGEGGKCPEGPPLGQLRSRLREPPAGRSLPQAIEALLAHLAPPGLLVDDSGTILRVLHEEAVRAALALPVMPARVSEIADTALRHALLAGLGSARLTGRATVEAGTAASLAVTCLPAGEQPLFLVTTDRPAKAETAAPDSVAVARLERELAGAAAALQASLGDLQAANEELRAANDELQAANDELSSVNEELHLVSAEHEARLGELAQLATDMENFLRGTAMGLVFLDEELALRRFTARAVELFAVVSDDVGRPIHEIRWRFDYPDLERDLLRCLEHEVALGRDVRTPGDGMFRIEMMPYRLRSGEVAGVVLVFEDVGALRKVQQQAQREACFAAGLAETAGLEVCRLDPQLRVLAASAAFARAVQAEPAGLGGRLLAELVPARTLAGIAATAAGLDPAKAEGSFLAEDAREPEGERLQRLWTLQAFFGDDGRLVELQAVGRKLPARG
ncbi:CheR family methyltransferase [Marinimicrococcus flavescens]|uniref:Chemotaxis protein CheB n=1 Tax=Marinimicrococcus flavescens TaxID=3031815 RepID=A0AAP3UXC1_9PROT|nr:chemotaxis protein CheB [Marinimicrococcus flavescens]